MKDTAIVSEDESGEPAQPVRIVQKGKLWVAEPLEPGEPLTAETVRQTQEWIRDRGLRVVDPFLHALLSAPMDEEPDTDDFDGGLSEAPREAREGQTISYEKVKRELGLMK